MARPKVFTEERQLIGLRVGQSLFDRISVVAEKQNMSVPDLCQELLNVTDVLSSNGVVLPELQRIADKNETDVGSVVIAVLTDYVNYSKKYQKSAKLL